MQRSVGKSIKIYKNVLVDEIINKEKITEIYINPDAKFINVTVVMLNEKEENIDTSMVSIRDADYDLLYSTGAFFDSGKQEGSYREIDLWKVIDKVSDQSNS